VDVPDVSYARSGDVAIAYQVVGDGPPDLLFLPFVSGLWWLWRYPHFAPFGNRLAESCQLVLVNTRGMGLSDRPRGVTIEARMDDVLAVLDALEIERCTLLGIGETAATSIVFAATYPEKVERLIVYIPFVRGVANEEYPWARTRPEWLESIRIERERWGERSYLEEVARRLNPQWADDPEYVEHSVWFNRHSLSPAAAAEFRRMQMELDVTDVLSAVRVPTLVFSKARLRDADRYAADRIHNARFVELPGEGISIFEHDGVYAAEAIETFLRGDVPAEVPETLLATTLFTDLVGSTERSAKLGDRAWRDLLARHHAVVRRELARFRGEERDTAGDGFFATFDGPARAIRAAEAIVAGVSELGLEIRIGVHTGECELHDGKVTGIAVSAGARVAAAAKAGEVLVSNTVKDLVAGSGIAFEERGTHELKGVPGEWRLYAVSSA
jgi:class 3 adenylate cyclase/pimeloyl-ACP methyl ester carboxylesterase